MRIAVVHSFYSARQPSGENSVVRAQVAALRDAGHTVGLFARYTDREAQARSYAVRSAVRVATGVGGGGSREVQEFGPDVVHVHNTFPNLGTRWFADMPNVVMSLHNYRAWCAAGTLMRNGLPCTDCLEVTAVKGILAGCYRASRLATVPLALQAMPHGHLQRALRRARVVTVLNAAMAELVEKTAGRPATLLPNFVDVPALPAEGPAEIPNGRWLYVGRLSEEKGVAQLLACWSGSGRGLDIIGDGPDMHRVRELAASLPDVRVLGSLDPLEVQRAMVQATGLVVPSIWLEGLPTVVLEALAAGLPVAISTRCASTPMLVNLGGAAPFDPGSQASLDSALSTIETAGASLRRKCVDVHAQHFSRAAWLGATEEIYRNVAAGS